jgi:hypothetical protein
MLIQQNLNIFEKDSFGTYHSPIVPVPVDSNRKDLEKISLSVDDKFHLHKNSKTSFQRNFDRLKQGNRDSSWSHLYFSAGHSGQLDESVRGNRIPLDKSGKMGRK